MMVTVVNISKPDQFIKRDPVLLDVMHDVFFVISC